MKFKSLFALALSLATIGLSLPALAGDRDGGNWDRKDRSYGEQQDEQSSGDRFNKKGHKYYGSYYPYKLDGYYIYIGSKGDYFDRYGKYYDRSEHPDYSQYFNRQYDYEQYGNYYDKYGKYHDFKQASHEDRRRSD